MDARAIGNEQIWQAAESLISKGLVYLCAWGPECERGHDCFDDAIRKRELDGSPEQTSDATIMTTWHSG